MELHNNLILVGVNCYLDILSKSCYLDMLRIVIRYVIYSHLDMFPEKWYYGLILLIGNIWNMSKIYSAIFSCISRFVENVVS